MNMDEEASNLSTFDIYSDLLLEQQTSGVPVSVDQLEKANVENEAKVIQLNQQLQSVQLQCKALEDENIILKRNISELFKTAQAELRRKDRQLDELETRRPMYQRKRKDFKTSFNDRLRNLRNNSRGHFNRSTSGTYHETAIDNQGPGGQQGSDSKMISAETEQVNSPGQTAIPDKTSAETSPVGSDQIKNGERIAKNSDHHLEERHLVKADGVRKYSYDNHRRAGESCRRQRDQNPPVRNSHEETSHRGRAKHETLPRQRSPEHKQWTVNSSTKHSKDSVVDDRKHSRSHSPHQSRSSERSKSRGRSRGSDRSSKRSDSRERNRELMKTDNEKQKKRVKDKKEKRTESNSLDKSDWSRSRRKRKHSSGRKQSLKSSHRSTDAAPHKKLRGHDKDKLPDTSDGRRFQYNHAERNQGARETLGSADLIHKRSHRTSHVVSNRSSKGSVYNDQHSRMRHKSDRKNKSLKRAKDTLHRKHSTPKKHRREERRKRLGSSSKASRSKDKTKELVVAGDKDVDNQDSSDTEWVPKEPVEFDRPQYRKSLAVVLREEGVIQHDVGVPEEDPALHASCIASHEVPQNHDLELHEEITSDSLYGCKEPQSFVNEEDKLSSANNESKENETTTIQSGTGDREVVDDQFNTEIHPDEQCKTNPSHILDTCQMEISRNQCSLPVSNIKTVVQVNEGEAAQEISSVTLPMTESCGSSSSGVQVCASASQVNERIGSSNSSPSKPSTATKNRAAHVKVETGETDVHVFPNSTKDLNCIKTSEETDAALDEHMGDIDESKVDRNAGKVPIEDSDLKHNTVSLDSCSKSKASSSRKTNNSFSEKIMDVFGSNSFLWSDDVDSSMEVTLPSITDTVDLPLAKTLQDNSAGDNLLVHKPTKKLENFSETLMNIFGSDSFIEGEDIETTEVAPLMSLTDVMSDGQPVCDTLQGNTASTKDLPGSTEINCSVDHKVTSGSVLETILETYDSGSLTSIDVKSSSQTSPMIVLVTEEPMIQSEDAMFETLPRSSAEKSDSKVKNDRGDLTSAAICSFDLKSNGILHEQRKSQWCQSDEYNTDATIELLVKTHTKNSSQKEDETGFRRDTDAVTDMIKSTGNHFEPTNEKPEARAEKEYVDELKLKKRVINQEGVSSKASPTTLLGKQLDKPTCHTKTNEQADLGMIPGVIIASQITSDVSIQDNVDMKSTLKTDFTDAGTSLADVEDGEVNDSETQGSHLEGVHEADISIDPSGYDFLSCSASPVHGNLLTDSDNSGQSDQEYHSDQVADDQLDDKPSENCNLSEGEIASSDSETSTNVISKKKEAHQTTDRKSNRTRSISLTKRSKREDKHSSSHRAKGHSRDRHKKLETEHDRLKFLEEKMRILEERQQARENPVRRRSESKYGINTSKNTERGSHSSIRRRLPSRESPEKRRAKKTTVEPRTRQADCRDQKRSDVHVDDVVRSRGSHSNCHQSSRRHDRDQCHDRPGNKVDNRTTQSAGELKRTRSARTHRR